MRKIDPALAEAIDNALKSNPDFDLSVANKMWRPLIVMAAKSFVDVTESSNKNDGLYVQMIQKTVDGKAQGEPYCCAFIQTLIAYVEYKTGLVSPIIPSEHCMTVWNNTPPAFKTTKFPQPGYFAMYNYKGTPDGHTGPVIATLDSYFKSVEANSFRNDGVTQGINLKYRPYGDVGDMALLGFICPF